MVSFFVYTITFLILFSFSILQAKNNIFVLKTFRIKPLHIIIIIFTIVFGLRYNVGIDYDNYLQLYKYGDFERLEFIFRGISVFCFNNNVHVVFYFSIWAFLQIYIFLSSFKNENFLYPALIFILFFGQYFLLWMNVIRQDIAACIFIFSITYIIDKKLFRYLLCIILAFGFHKTAILLLPLYFVFSRKQGYFNSISIQLALYIVAVIIGLSSSNIMTFFDSVLQPFLSILGYEGYDYGGIESSFQQVSIGTTFLVSFLIDIVLICYNKKIKSFFNNSRLLCFYDLYFIGVVLTSVFAQSFILLRPVRYFRFFEMIISAYLVYYLYKKNKLLMMIFIILLYTLLYIALFMYPPEACYIYHLYPFNVNSSV